ncbi:efflux transporter periplasmic adaptor subunit, partial [Pseudomonas avellanae]
LPKGGENALSLSVDGTDYQSTGTLLFTDVAVDRTTGQVSLRARFANPKGVLLPGMYVRVRTPQRVDANAILVPQRAVQRSSDGAARVLVIAQDGTAEARPVKTGAMQDSRWQITEGLKDGEQIIIGNMTGLNPGDKVVPKSPSAQQQAKAQ